MERIFKRRKLEPILSLTKLSIKRIALLLFNYSIIQNTLALICSKCIKEVASDGKLINLKIIPNEGRVTMLFLSHERFRDDLLVLSAAEKVRVLIINHYLQTRLFSIYYPKMEITDAMLHAVGADSPFARHQEIFHAFLRGFLASLYKVVQVDCVISSDVRNDFDFDWGVVSKYLGVPYIVFHRENLVASLTSYNRARETMKSLKRFRGNYIIVHNDIEKRMFLESGYVDESQISALGCLRMDNFIKRIKNGNFPKTKRKRFLYFPFEISAGGIDAYHKVLGVVLQFAIQHPEIDVIVKPKADFYLKWEKNTMEKFFENAEIYPDKIQNLQILPYADAQDLILESDVICVINSTVLLEAGIAGKQVIIPYLKESQESDDIKLKDYFNLFEVALDEIELKSKILENLNNLKQTSEEIMEGRRKVFEKFVSSMDADATGKYLSIIKEIVS